MESTATTFVRTSSNPQCEQEIIYKFVTKLEHLHELYIKLLPDFIDDAIEQIGEDLTQSIFSKRKAQLNQLLRYLKQYKKLKIFSYNGSKYTFDTLNLNHFLLNILFTLL